MKRFVLSSLLLLAIALGSYARTLVAKGKTYLAVGDYRIEVADKPFVLDGRELKTYVISYANNPMEVTVAIDKGKKCSTYLVLSDKLSIQYVCNESYFGVEKIAKAYGKHGLQTSDNQLNRSEYFHQKVLTNGDNSMLENAKLIAAFYPALVKDINSTLAAR